jgi:hypothetical protein
MMKILFLTLAAVVGLALGAASMVPAAHAATVSLYPASNSAG